MLHPMGEEWAAQKSYINSRSEVLKSQPLFESHYLASINRYVLSDTC
jgi:hypothetical protein